jgi:uncharacterized lipoprotein YmbA
MPDLDEDILRQLMLRSTDDLFASPHAASAAITRQRRHRLRTRVIGVAGTAAAAGLAVGTLASTSGTGARPQASPRGSGAASQTVPIRLTAAQRTLFGLSAAAAKTHRPAGRYVVLAEKSYSIGYGSGGNSSVSGPKTSVIDTITGGGLTYQDLIVSGSGSAGTPTPPAVLTGSPGDSPTVAQLDAMPTGTAALRTELLAQAEKQLSETNKFFQAQAKKDGKKIKAGTIPQPTDDDLVYEQAADLLWEPDLSPALRSALYKVLAATPGVIVKTGAVDSSGRPAVEISRVDTVAKTDVETFENPITGRTLESAWRSSGELDEDLYLGTTYTNTIPPDPYKG